MYPGIKASTVPRQINASRSRLPKTPNSFTMTPNPIQTTPQPPVNPSPFRYFPPMRGFRFDSGRNVTPTNHNHTSSTPLVYEGAEAQEESDEGSEVENDEEDGEEGEDEDDEEGADGEEEEGGIEEGRLHSSQLLS